MSHIPVLQKEVLEYLNTEPNENFIDCTIGEGGHTLAILEQNKPNGKVLGVEIDQQLYENLKTSEIKNHWTRSGLPEGLQSKRNKFLTRPATHTGGASESKNRLILVNDSFVNLKKIVEKYKFKPLHGVLFDLGFSSWHLEGSGRGFSFLRNEPLDMRYDKNSELSAEKIINEKNEKEIEEIIKEYGQERFAKNISKEIIASRKKWPIKTTFQLVEIIKRAVPAWYRHKKIHFATRTFQALRIAANNELNNLEKTLPQALYVLTKEGRLAVISFHSLEDRIVKYFFKKETEKGTVRILTKKPVRPSNEEIKINPRSRSAKLRAAIKL